MKYSEGKCPKCGKVMLVPEDLNKLTCMYCGKEIEVGDMLPVSGAAIEQNQSAHSAAGHDNDDISEVMNSHKFTQMEEELQKLWESKDINAVQKAEILLETDSMNYTANYIMAFHLLPDMLLKNKSLMNQFKRNLYESAMQEYMDSIRPSMEYLQRACDSKSSDTEEILKECAKYCVKTVKEDMLNSSGDKIKPAILDNFKLILAVFTIPMILELKFPISESFADALIEAWRNEFPKSAVLKGTYEQINNGFKRKGFCFITTAVCESLDKTDDCYELNMFRRFRDGYLADQKEGQELIQEYYRKAPFIVGNINLMENSDSIYQNIWKEYLQDCLTFIESGQNEKCKNTYTAMFHELERRYS